MPEELSSAERRLRALRSSIAAESSRAIQIGRGEPVPDAPWSAFQAPSAQVPELEELPAEIEELPTGIETLNVSPLAQEETAEARLAFPGLPPTLAINVSPEVGKRLEAALASAIPSVPDDRDKIILLAHRLNSPEGMKLRNKLFDKMQARELSETTERRFKSAIQIVDDARVVQNDDGIVTGPALTEFIDQSLLTGQKIGPNKKIRVSLYRNPETGRLVINVPKSYRDSYSAHAQDIAREKGVNLFKPDDPEKVREVIQAARDRAASDVTAIAVHGRNTAFFDPGDIDIEEMAKSPFRAIKTQWRARSPHGDVWHPTVDELAKEGTFNWFVHATSPFDWMATKAKLIRERLSKNGEPLTPGLFWFYTRAAAFPIVNDIAIAGLGITPEEEVQAFVDGWTLIQEGQVAQGELASLRVKAIGGDPKAQRYARDVVINNPASAVLPMAMYLFEPDGFTGAVWAIGKSAKYAKGAHTARPMVRAAALLKGSAVDSEVTLSKALNDLKNADEVLGTHAEIIIRHEMGKGQGTLDELVATIGARRTEAEVAEKALVEIIGRTDVDDLTAIARLAKDNPEIASHLKNILELRAREVGLTEAMISILGERAKDIDKIIGEQRIARATRDSLGEKLNRAAAELVIAENKSPAFRDYVAADTVVLTLTGQQKAALAAKDVNLITEITGKLKKAKAARAKFGKKLSVEEKDLMAKFRKETKVNSRVWRKADGKFQGDEALSGLQAEAQTIRENVAGIAPRLARSRESLAQVSRRFTVADPAASKAFTEALKAGDIAGTAADTIKINRKLVGDFVDKERRLAKAVDANRWRKIALNLADDYVEAAKVVRRSTSRGLIFHKTGILGAKTEEATELFSSAVKEGPHLAFDSTAFSFSERAAKGGRAVEILNAQDEAIKLTARVADESPDLLTVEKLETAERLDSAAAVNTIQAMVDYAKRNNLGLDLSAAEAHKIGGMLRAAGVPLNKSGKISADSLRAVGLETTQARLADQSARIMLDGRGLRPKLEAAFGPEAVTHILTKMGDEGRILELAFKSDAPIAITLDMAAKIQLNVAEVLARASKLLDPKYKHEKLAAILLDAKAYHPAFGKNLLSSMGEVAIWVLRSHDPWLRRLGTSAEEVTQIVRGGENLVELGWDEYEQLLRQAGKGREAIRIATFRYLDTGAKQLLPNSKTTMFNLGTRTIFQRAKRALLGDTTRLQYAAAESIEQAARVNNPAILGLSRVWLPPGTNVHDDIAKALYTDAVTNLKKASTAEEFMALQRTSTSGKIEKGFVPVGEGENFINLNVDSRIGRVHAFATRSFIAGAAYDEIAITAKKASMGLMSADTADDINNILKGNAIAVQNVDEAFDGLYAMGLSFMERQTEVGRRGWGFLGEAVKETKEIIRLAGSDSGEAIWGLSLARNRLDEALGGYVKSLAATPPVRLEWAKEKAKWAVGAVMNLWRTDAVVGFIIPNAARPIYDGFGDWAQQAFSDRFGFANKVVFQNSISAIPKLGPYLQNRMSRAAKAGTGPPILRTIVETTFNPHIDDFWQGRPGALRIGKNGPLVSYDYLRKRAVLDGITDSRTSAEVLDLAQKVASEDPFFKRLLDGGTTMDAIWRPAKNWQQGITRWVQTTQQRQRVGTWLLHLDEGRHLDEAARLTRNAIYDWRHGISEAELLYGLRALPFYRWFRLTSSQLGRGLTDSITKPPLEVFANAATGQTKANRLRVMYRGQHDFVPYLFDPRSPEKIAEEEGFKQAFARGFFPEWMKASMTPRAGIWAADRGDLEKNARVYGDPLARTHWAGALPPNGLLDVANIWSAGPMMMMAAYLAATGEEIAADDLKNKSVQHITGLMYPTHREYLESALGVSPYGAGGMDLSRPVPITPAQADICKMAGVEIWYDEDRGKFMTMPGTAAILLNLPGLTISLPRLINDWKYRNPGVGDGLTKQMMHLALNQTKLYRTYDYNPIREYRRAQRRISRAAKSSERKAELVKGKK
jgi:hypothetical protein